LSSSSLLDADADDENKLDVGGDMDAESSLCIWDAAIGASDDAKDSSVSAVSSGGRGGCSSGSGLVVVVVVVEEKGPTIAKFPGSSCSSVLLSPNGGGDVRPTTFLFFIT
jgi:hypothetical protein